MTLYHAGRVGPWACDESYVVVADGYLWGGQRLVGPTCDGIGSVHVNPQAQGRRAIGSVLLTAVEGGGKRALDRRNIGRWI